MVETDIPAPDVSGNSDSPKIYVYVIDAGGDAVKIGVAKNVRRRLKELQTGQHRRMEVFYELACTRADAYAIECRAHALLTANLLEGEWFSVSPKDGKRAVEQALADWREESRTKAERLKTHWPAYQLPLVLKVAGHKADEFTALEIVKRVAPDEKEVVVLFDDRAIFLGRGMANEESASPVYMINDVTRWYMPASGAAA